MFAHIDADAFFASVLVRRQPKLRGKPLLALGMGGSCVIAASYEAKACGVRTGMPLAEARRLVPEAIAILSDFTEACTASRQIEEVIAARCPRIERASVDEWYADLTTCVGGKPSDPRAWALQLQEHVRTTVHLTVSAGIAPTKLLAKMASEYRKPAGTAIVGEGELGIEQFLRDRPAAAIPGIGRRRHTHTEAHGWRTAWDIAHAPTEELLRLFGMPGKEMQQELLGMPVHRVAEGTRPPKSLSRCRSFRAVRAPGEIRAHVLTHLSRLVLRMRSKNLACNAIAVWLRTARMDMHGHELRLPQYMQTEEALLPYADACMNHCMRHGTAYTQAGLALLKLKPSGPAQASLFEGMPRADASEAVQQTLDEIRLCFGRGSVVRASTLRHAARQSRERPTVHGAVGFCR